jgi:uncharacterized protein
MDVRMQLARVIVCERPDQNCYIVLSEQDGERNFPIMIGFYEASQIDRRLRGQIPQRPIIYELLSAVIEALDAHLEKVLVDDIQEGTFYAKLVLRREGEPKPILVDCRPSDAIALGVASDTPIYVAEHVLSAVC